MGAFGWRIPALLYSLHELMTGEPKIRFPEATQPDTDGWWPAAQWDTPGGLGDVSALPSLKDAGITHPPSAKMARPKVSVIKDDQVELLDPPVAPPMPKPASSARGKDTVEKDMVEMDHPPMVVTPSADGTPGQTEGSATEDGQVEDVTGAIKVAFTKEESEAILLKAPVNGDTPVVKPSGEQPEEASEPAVDEVKAPVVPATPKAPERLVEEEAKEEEAKAVAAKEVPAKSAAPEDGASKADAAKAVDTAGVEAGADEAPQAEAKSDAPTPVSDVKAEPPVPTESAASTPPVTAKAPEPTPAPAMPKALVAEAPAEPEADATKAAPARPAKAPEPAPKEASPQPKRPAKRPAPEPEPAFVFNPKTMPISPPAPSIPGDDTDSLIVESFTEAEDDLSYSGPFSTVPPTSGARWGQTAKERRQAKRYQQAIERNLDNSHAPLDVLFAEDRHTKARRMALRPSFGRDLLVWLIAIVGVGQLVYRGWAILPTLNTFNANISDFQILAAMSLMVGGAVSAVLALIAVRFITGMRSAFAWGISVFLVFGIFPWYGFGSQLSPTGLPPLPKPIDVVFNPVFDQNGLLGITLIGLAICAIIATITAMMVGTTTRS